MCVRSSGGAAGAKRFAQEQKDNNDNIPSFMCSTGTCPNSGSLLTAAEKKLKKKKSSSKSAKVPWWAILLIGIVVTLIVVVIFWVVFVRKPHVAPASPEPVNEVSSDLSVIDSSFVWTPERLPHFRLPNFLPSSEEFTTVPLNPPTLEPKPFSNTSSLGSFDRLHSNEINRLQNAHDPQDLSSWTEI